MNGLHNDKAPMCYTTERRHMKVKLSSGVVGDKCSSSGGYWGRVDRGDSCYKVPRRGGKGSCI
eukprot:scaffold57817_cov30-Tisochrysis_lutea.AAC.5